MKSYAVVLILGYALGVITLAGCAAAVEYHYYALDIPTDCYDKGQLIGKPGASGWVNLPFDECKPDDTIKGKCVVELSADHFAKEKELVQCRAQLSECQNPKPQ